MADTERYLPITEVGSRSRPGVKHQITWDVQARLFCCSCESFRYNRDRDSQGCPHIRGMMGVVVKVNSCLKQAQDARGSSTQELAVA